MKQCQKCGNTFDELSNHWTLYNHYCSKCVIDDLERGSEEEVSALMKMFEDMLNE